MAGLVVVEFLHVGLFEWQRQASSSGPVSASATCGEFQLKFMVDRTTWHPSEAVNGAALFSYLGEGTGHWAGSGQGPLGFEYRQVDGDIDVQPVWTSDLVVHDIPAASPLYSYLTKAGAYDPNGPQASFYATFFDGPQVHLPVGEWEISAITDHGCTDASPPLRATVRIQVRP